MLHLILKHPWRNRKYPQSNIIQHSSFPLLYSILSPIQSLLQQWIHFPIITSQTYFTQVPLNHIILQCNTIQLWFKSQKCHNMIAWSVVVIIAHNKIQSFHFIQTMSVIQTMSYKIIIFSFIGSNNPAQHIFQIKKLYFYEKHNNTISISFLQTILSSDFSKLTLFTIKAFLVVYWR